MILQNLSYHGAWVAIEVERNCHRRIWAALALCLAVANQVFGQPLLSNQSLDNFDASQSPNLDNGVSSDINNRNIVVGWYDFGSPAMTKPYVWRNQRWPSGRTIALLPDLTGISYGYGLARGIRNGPNPTIVGQQRNGGGVYRAVRWVTTDGVNYTCQDLQAAPFNWEGNATSINDSNTVVGEVRVGSASGPIHAFRFSSGTLTPLFPGADTRTSIATAINGGGRICGSVDIGPANPNDKAFYWDGTVQNLPQNSGGPYVSSQAFGINSDNDIVGRVNDGTGWRACLWTWNGLTYDNPVLLASYGSAARDINDSNTIVGESDGRGFLYEAGVLYDVNALGLGGFNGMITGLNAVNDRFADGHRLHAIAGAGMLVNGSFRSSVLRWAKGDLEIEPVHGAIGSVSITTPVVAPLGSTAGTYSFTYRGSEGEEMTDYRGSETDVTLAVDATSGVSIDGGGAERTYTVGADDSALDFTISNTDWTAYGKTVTVTGISSGYWDGSATFVINNPVPSITSISPTSATIGSSDITLTVNGSNFSPSSKVRWNGVDIPVLSIAETQIQALVSADKLTSAGEYSVRVFNPTPAGGGSSPLPFTVTGRVISGHLDLEGYSGSTDGLPVEIEIRAVGGSTALVSQTVALDASSNYTLTADIAAGNYDVLAKGPHWLRKRRMNQSVTGSSTTGVNLSLFGGDCNGDNVVDIADYAQLSAAYGSALGDSNYDPDADLPGDESVDIADFALVSSNWNREGEE